MRTLERLKYMAPQDLQEALGLLTEYQGLCQVLAGGTDLIVRMRQRTVAPDVVIDVKKIPGLDEITRDETGALSIGACCTIGALAASELAEQFPIVKDVAAKFANMQVRSRATIGGNICRSSPAGDALPMLLVLDATAELACLDGVRSVPLAEFFTGPGTNAMAANELLTGVKIPSYVADGSGSAFIKLMRSSEDLAKLSAAAHISIEKGVIRRVRVAAGAVAPVPKRLLRVEKALEGAQASSAAITQAAPLTADEISPVSDTRSTQEYRLLVTPVAVRRALELAMERCQS